jgi:hypothetical protein
MRDADGTAPATASSEASTTFFIKELLGEMRLFLNLFSRLAQIVRHEREPTTDQGDNGDDANYRNGVAQTQLRPLSSPQLDSTALIHNILPSAPDFRVDSTLPAAYDST